MKTVLDLLKPRLWPLLHRRPAGSTRQYVRLAVVTTVAGALWIGVFMVSLRVLTHFSTTKDPDSPFAATYNADASPSQTLGTWTNFQQKDYGPPGQIPPMLMSYGYGDGGGHAKV